MYVQTIYELFELFKYDLKENKKALFRRHQKYISVYKWDLGNKIHFTYDAKFFFICMFPVIALYALLKVHNVIILFFFCGRLFY